MLALEYLRMSMFHPSRTTPHLNQIQINLMIPMSQLNLRLHLHPRYHHLPRNLLFFLLQNRIREGLFTGERSQGESAPTEALIE
jgi:hypothetical protein